MAELTQPDTSPLTADGTNPDASRVTDASLGDLRVWRKCLLRLLAGESSCEVTLTKKRRVLRDPEVRKNIEILAARISDAIDLNRRLRPQPDSELPEEPQPDSELPEEMDSLVELLCGLREALCLETLLDTRCRMELLLLECADLPLLRQRTAEEYAEEDSTLLTWRRLYGAELPELLNDSLQFPSEPVQYSTRMRLQRLVDARFEHYRPLRARRRLRIIYLRYIAPIMLIAGFLFGLAIGMEASAVLLKIFNW